MIKNLIAKIAKSDKTQSIPQQKERDPVRYEKERGLAKSGSLKERKKLAESPNTHLEILYYLAEKDPDAQVRQAVAKNSQTPLQVSEALAKDSDVDVRLTLLKRLCDLLPDLSAEEYSELYAFAAQALGVLALDEVLKVRLALSSALRDKAYAPPKVVAQLARDLERQVSEPILKYCSALPDEELLTILSEHPKDWVIQAIAGREEVSEDVSEAVIKTGDIPAGGILIQNKGARISDETIATIVEKARELPEWHKPLALRKDLPPDMIKSIALFVSKAVRRLLLENADMDSATKKEVMRTAERRIGFFLDKKGKPVDPLDKLKELIHDNKLNQESIEDAMALRETGFVEAALTHKSGLPAKTIHHILKSKVPKAVVSLVWKAGLDMRFAFKVQKDHLQIKPSELLYPKSGKDWPLTEKEMAWQVEFFSDSA